MRYAIVIEKAEDNYSAYVPDLPGCVATGATVEEAESPLRAAIAFHLDGMRDDETPISGRNLTLEFAINQTQRLEAVDRGHAYA